MDRRTSVVAVVSTTLALTACGGGGSNVPDDSVAIGVYPASALSLPIYVADQQGMFDDQGLVVELINGKSGPELITALIGGTTEIAVGAPGTVVPAIQQGQHLRLLPPYGSIDLSIAVTEDSGITGLEELPGKRVAVPARGGAAEQFVTELLTEEGIDPSNVQFIAAAPTASQIPLARKGDVDAAVLTFASRAAFEAQGVSMEPITSVTEGTAGEVGSYGLGTVLVASGTLAESDAAEPVCAALSAAGEWIADPTNKEAGTELLVKTMNVPADKAAEVWAAQMQLWPEQIAEERWRHNVEWVNDQTSGAREKDVPFDPVC